MLSPLPPKPSDSLAQNATLPRDFEFDAAATGPSNRNQSHGVGIHSHVNSAQRQDLVIPSTIPESTPPPRPSRTHQRSHTEYPRTTQNLPPLVVSQPFPTVSDVHKLNPPTAAQLEDFSQSTDSSRQCSPTRSSIIKADTSNSEPKTTKIASWFQGESAPVRVGLVPSPTKEAGDSLATIPPTRAARPAGILHRRSATQVTPKPAMASRFSFFNSKASLARSTPPVTDYNDELADLDINLTLFPGGPPDPFSPAAFKNLQLQAEGALTRLQLAYRKRTTALRDIAAENEALVEETQGAETRAKHLKMQLDAMAEQLAEQDRAMMNMVDELAQEKLARREEEEIRKRSVRLVENNPVLPTAPRSRPRRSTLSDSGFESEDESSVESLFSRRDGTHSPTMSMSSVSTDNSPETCHPRDILHSPTQAARLRIPPAPKPVQQPCTNCHGIRASDAWPVVSVLREENQGLKQRVGELEGALDGCLDVVGRLGA